MPDTFCYPKRIILSRKGWDSTNGGSPSPILPDGRLLSLPIDDCGSDIRFQDLRSDDNQINVGTVVEDLTHKKVRKETELHLDPDLRDNAISRDFFQPAFGQCGSAQGHLEKQGVREQDLFLFFGLFRQIEKTQAWRYIPYAPKLDIVFGWLQIGEIFKDINKLPQGLERHPHRIMSFRVKKEAKNTIYIPSPKLTFRELPGWGLFQAPFSQKEEHDPRCLSRPGGKLPTQWRLPSFFAGLSNMGKHSPAPTGQFWEPQRKGFGQEFVLGTDRNSLEIHKWLDRLFQKVSTPRSTTTSIL
jgi:Nucleotide modification associated domain 3